MASCELNASERDVIRLALRGDVGMRRYVPEVMDICAKLGISEPPWFDDESVRERVAFNRGDPPEIAKPS